ncbi:helix-turn-helix domain-containing protein [Oceanobacillus alkalisoli]|uniref:helix-turn-helix domain-containing protein n=1 Tax=Oceanobacillus alkalisoli TaxID=2925113 RepID=UPI001F11C9A8|nr:helix-turn-helix domain-containing protein [Oceanobacillus alkalisoli]MCF3942227.1 DNA-binding protein [Oceanobacillus alkalisoli]
MKEIDNYMTPAEAAYRWGIKIERLKERLKPSRNNEEIEQMVKDGQIKYFIEPGKKNRSWIISTDAMEKWYPKESKNVPL